MCKGPWSIVILSILATVAVLAAIAVIAAALVFAETTLVYVALGLGGASVLLLLGSLSLQTRFGESGTDRDAGTDGLGKSSVPLATADVVATAPGPHTGPEETWRAPAPTFESAREVAVSGTTRSETAGSENGKKPDKPEFDAPRWQIPAVAEPDDRSRWEAPATNWPEAPSDDSQSYGEHEESDVRGVSAFDTPEVPFAYSVLGTVGTGEPDAPRDPEDSGEYRADVEGIEADDVGDAADVDGGPEGVVGGDAAAVPDVSEACDDALEDEPDEAEGVAESGEFDDQPVEADDSTESVMDEDVDDASGGDADESPESTPDAFVRSERHSDAFAEAPEPEEDADTTDALTRPDWISGAPVEEPPDTQVVDDTGAASGPEDPDTVGDTAEDTADEPESVEGAEEQSETSLGPGDTEEQTDAADAVEDEDFEESGSPVEVPREEGAETDEDTEPGDTEEQTDAADAVEDEDFEESGSPVEISREEGAETDEDTEPDESGDVEESGTAH